MENIEEKIFTDILEMLQDIKSHTVKHGGNIIQNDNPFKLQIGYACTVTNQQWKIKITDIKNSLNTLKNCNTPETMDKVSLIEGAFKTQEGKNNLLKSINGSSS